MYFSANSSWAIILAEMAKNRLTQGFRERYKSVLKNF